MYSQLLVVHSRTATAAAEPTSVRLRTLGWVPRPASASLQPERVRVAATDLMAARTPQVCVPPSTRSSSHVTWPICADAPVLTLLHRPDVR